MPTSRQTDEALDRLPTATKAKFVKLGLARTDSYSTGGPMKDHLVATWILRTAFTWTQTFPAGRPVKMEQSYRPSVGGSAQTFIGADQWRKLPEASGYLRKFCVDAGIINAIAQARSAKKRDYPPFSEERIAYVLKTGANWAGPIRDFHLVIDKGAPSNLVSFCADGVKKISPTRFEIHKTDFIPKQDLFVLILKPIE